MGVVLVVPEFAPFPERSRDVHFGLEALASFLRRSGQKVTKLDLNFVPTDRRLATVLNAAGQGEVVGFTSYTCNHHRAEFYANEIRRQFRGKVLVAGGPHVTGLFIEKELKTGEPPGVFDAMFVGESERVFLDYCRSPRSERPRGWVVGEPVPARELDLLPPVMRDGIDYSRLECARILTSRGCPHKCAMCVNSGFDSPLRPRGIDAIVAEVKSVAALTDSIFFVDDGFASSAARVEAICQSIRRAKLNVTWSCLMRADVVEKRLVNVMKEAGCIRISIGCESGAPRILRSIKKGLEPGTIQSSILAVKGSAIECRTSWIVGLPDESDDTARETRHLLLDAKPDVAVVYPAIPYPGTRLARNGKDLIIDRDYRNYFGGSGQVLMRSRHLDQRQISDWIERICADARAVGIRVDTSFRPLDGVLNSQ